MIIHQCISGFTQNFNTLHGVMKLSERLRMLGHSDGFHKRVMLHRWCSNWKSIAEQYWILSEFYLEEITVCIYAYSWGAGWGAMQLAKHLQKCRLDVKVMVLSDPVYRHPNYLFRPLSLFYRDSTFSPIIRVPQNVHEVFSLHQRVNRPQGHRLLNTNGTLIHPSILIDNTVHQKMDDNWTFHALSLEVARRVGENLPLSSIDIKQLDLGTAMHDLKNKAVNP